MSFAGTEHYRERAQHLKDDIQFYNRCREPVPDLSEEAEEMCEKVVELCDHIEAQDKEIERLKGVVEYHMRKAYDEHARWSGYYYDECTKSVDLRFRIAQLEKELAARTESSEEKP